MHRPHQPDALLPIRHPLDVDHLVDAGHLLDDRQAPRRGADQDDLVRSRQAGDARDQGPDRAGALHHHRRARPVADARPGGAPLHRALDRRQGVGQGLEQHRRARIDVGGDLDHLQVVVARQVDDRGEAGAGDPPRVPVRVGQRPAPGAGLRVAQDGAGVAAPAGAPLDPHPVPRLQRLPGDVHPGRLLAQLNDRSRPLVTEEHGVGHPGLRLRRGVHPVHVRAETPERSILTSRSLGARGWRSYSLMLTTPGLSRLDRAERLPDRNHDCSLPHAGSRPANSPAPCRPLVLAAGPLHWPPGAGLTRYSAQRGADRPSHSAPGSSTTRPASTPWACRFTASVVPVYGSRQTTGRSVGA